MAYPSVLFESKEKRTQQNSFGDTDYRSFSKVDKLPAFHENIESCMKMLQMVSKVELSVACKDGQKLLV